MEARLKLLESTMCPGMSVPRSSKNEEFQSKVVASPNPEHFVSTVDISETDQEEDVKVEILEGI